ncbi:MAG: Rpn family recombination-promoting nuclease/putative transposase [Chloroflexaceae bacterium]|nr:Rpn family recombination-promoting nuclease/putative transposase [Chloroflexaceae bacterium]
MYFGSRYIDPTTDFGFKRLFGQEDSKEILRGFLHAILDPPHPIVDLSYMPTEQMPELTEERTGIYDVYCVDSEGQRFIVEMQRAKQIFFKDRSLYHVTFPIIQQMRRGEREYPFRLLPIYCIAVLNFRMDDDPRHMRHIALCDEATGRVFYDKLTFVYIELPKFAGTLDDNLSLADKWIYVLQNMPALADIPAELAAEEPFPQAFEKAQQAALTPAERERYEAMLKKDLDEQGKILNARNEGIHEAKLEMARAMLARGIDRATVLAISGLQPADLNEL